jgi:DNA-binding NarL/FixJ family response regulator
MVQRCASPCPVTSSQSWETVLRGWERRPCNVSVRQGGISLTLGILLIDDNEPYRVGVHALLESGGSVEVRGEGQELRWLEAGTAEEGLRKVQTLQPDIVLVDLRLPDQLGNPNVKVGLDLTKRLLRDFKETKVVILTVCDDLDLVREALEAGARGYLVKDADDHKNDLIRTVQAVANDERVLGRPAGDILPRLLRGDVAADRLPPPFDVLHPVRDKRLCEIALLLGQGLEVKEIAKRLDTPATTINNQVSELVKRSKKTSRNQLYYWAGKVLGR